MSHHELPSSQQLLTELCHWEDTHDFSLTHPSADRHEQFHPEDGLLLARAYAEVLRQNPNVPRHMIALAAGTGSAEFALAHELCIENLTFIDREFPEAVRDIIANRAERTGITPTLVKQPIFHHLQGLTQQRLTDPAIVTIFGVEALMDYVRNFREALAAALAETLPRGSYVCVAPQRRVGRLTQLWEHRGFQTILGIDQKLPQTMLGSDDEPFIFYNALACMQLFHLPIQ